MSGDFINGNGTPEIPELEYRCPHCDAVLGEDRSFCHKCGKYLGNPNVHSGVSEQKASKIRLIVGVVAIIIFLVLFFTLK